MSQIVLTADALTASPAPGAFEYDGTAAYVTPTTAQRGVILSDQIIIQQSVYTLTSQTAAQKLFNATTNGQVTLTAGTYWFECFFSLSSMNTVTGNSFGFALGGTATITQSWVATARKSAFTDTSGAPPTNPAYVTYNTTANTGLTATNTVATGFARVIGTVIVTVGGTLIPQVSLTVAAAAVVGVGSYFLIRPYGTSSVSTVGNWS